MRSGIIDALAVLHVSRLAVEKEPDARLK